ncbi:TetR family transcriptional regulator C-terminal domain-containing protein [Streptomyces sp. XM4193]|uniref:TetR/AcrR family transcriptional regulator n=1 Tax=Streptomyces sp. XM4193 TaxID=2929782 RepID=UPI001FF7A7D0|nr:TetR/AcrR family transcriptional regulator [Streptomyces sp. XM4193]MCK1797614.1 TetR family transcriptional regulator C-terminal domain-containing protein [Streptomyces sp. XM4193]
MPKRVDPDVRREQVADAVIEEIAAHGLRSITLARIAARSGFAIGSIRHYFGDTLTEVMRFTLSVLIQRAQNRAPELPSDPATRIINLITFAAPTSDQERKENTALVEYRVLGRTDPEIGAEIAAASAAAGAAVRSILSEYLADRAVDEEALRREALLLVTLTEGFSLSSALLSAPLQESDVHAVVASSVQRLRDAYPIADRSAPTS